MNGVLPSCTSIPYRASARSVGIRVFVHRTPGAASLLLLGLLLFNRLPPMPLLLLLLLLPLMLLVAVCLIFTFPSLQAAPDPRYPFDQREVVAGAGALSCGRARLGGKEPVRGGNKNEQDRGVHGRNRGFPAAGT